MLRSVGIGLRPLIAKRYRSQMGKISAACVIIGDEILNGKVIDKNSSFLPNSVMIKVSN